MRGETTITLNQQTIMEAIQAYLDLHITPKVKLESFVAVGGGAGYGSSPTYNCVVKEIDILAEPMKVNI